jgi:rubrerythrin
MRWHYEQDIPFEKIEKERVHANRFLLQTLAIASFIEITSELYDSNLGEYYAGDDETVAWLHETWEPEEVQHGQALKRYIETVWPEFEWQRHYDRFVQEYAPLCTVEALEPTRAREMLARMVVETGTSTLYKMLASYAKELREPVLEKLASLISKDEVYHFEMFEKVFEKYKAEEKLGKKEITSILYKRLKTVNNEDVKIAYEVLECEEPYNDYLEKVSAMAKKHYPYKQASRMFIRPLGLHPSMERLIAGTVAPAFKMLGI